MGAQGVVFAQLEAMKAESAGIESLKAESVV